MTYKLFSEIQQRTMNQKLEDVVCALAANGSWSAFANIRSSFVGAHKHDLLLTTKNMKQLNSLQQLKQFDDARPGVPGEHLFALGVGLAAWWLTRRHPSFIVRSIGIGVGTALIGRAASGRDGISRILRLLPVGRTITNKKRTFQTEKSE